MAEAIYVKKARKPNPVVSQADIDRANAGEVGAASYYYWSNYREPNQYSKTPPRKSQTAGSDYLKAVYGLQEEMAAATANDQIELEGLRDDWASQARDIANECQEKLDNMPDGLREGDTGTMLQERSDAMEEWADELENVDLDDQEEWLADNPGADTSWAEAKLEELRNVEPNL